MAHERETWQALGLTRSQRAVALAAPGSGCGGRRADASGAWVASAMMPFGLARQAEPTPGVQFDVLVLVGAHRYSWRWPGSLCVLVAPCPEAHSTGNETVVGDRRGSAHESAGLAPPVAIGVRAALQRAAHRDPGALHGGCGCGRGGRRRRGLGVRLQLGSAGAHARASTASAGTRESTTVSPSDPSRTAPAAGSAAPA